MKTSLIALLFAMTATAAGAAPIAGLFNTGTNASDLALTGGNGVADQHYIISSSTSGAAWTGATPVTYYNSAYLPDDSDSRWISMSANGSPGDNTTVLCADL